jgi:hypothetical protein
MFIENKYYEWYKTIISRPILEKNTTVYTEKHHIIPKSLGGSNSKENLVRLTAREHFMCHLLLPEFTEGRNQHKMKKALWAMINLKSEKRHKRDYRIVARMYETLRQEIVKIQSENYIGEGNPFYGKTHSEETRQKLRDREISENTKALMSLAHKATYADGRPGTFLNKHHSEESKLQMAISARNRKVKVKWKPGRKRSPKFTTLGTTLSDERKREISIANAGTGNPFYGRTHSEESRKQMSISHLAEPKKTCPHCMKTIDSRNYGRWHGDNCKNKK